MALGANTAVFRHLRIAFNASLKNCPSSSPNLRQTLFIHRRHHSSNATCRFPRVKFFAVPANAKTAITEETPQSHYVHPSTSTSWAEFAEKVSGEWDGYGADFSKDGEPMELPESVVPQAYRDWEVKVFDWQTQCPTLAHPTHFQLTYKLIRLLPTVGCEADAATTYSLLERNINLLLANAAAASPAAATAFAYQSNGCYVAVWPKENGGSLVQLELEHCLIHPRDRESRVRIIQAVRIKQQPPAEDGDDQGEPMNMMQLEGIQVFCEQWYGPFRNGEQLGGCAIRDSAFASTPALTSCQVTGVWQGLPATATFQPEEERANFRELVVDDDDSVPLSVSRDGSSLILLPKQLWCSSNQEEEQGETWFQVGWLLDRGLAITSKCSFSADAKLKEVVIACETAKELMTN
ncbi:uncharacterized protein LOC113783350 [Coffea eugenioides]|uniref:uncharacterized protein LOC113783350 n=1 Tax=Coffea eugenioides TaxID=49369 RepID=UPI000F615CAF|nr:uncharacterized protein LOC113783350 [Coffea eugenioides]